MSNEDVSEIMTPSHVAKEPDPKATGLFDVAITRIRAAKPHKLLHPYFTDDLRKGWYINELKRRKNMSPDDGRHYDQAPSLDVLPITNSITRAIGTAARTIMGEETEPLLLAEANTTRLDEVNPDLSSYYATSILTANMLGIEDFEPPSPYDLPLNPATNVRESRITYPIESVGITVTYHFLYRDKKLPQVTIAFNRTP